MTTFWDQAVDVLKEAILAYGFVFNGNLGGGILAVTFLARLALVPVTLRLARTTTAHKRVMRKIQPELDAIKIRFAKDARKTSEETRKIFSREGISPVPLVACLGALAQAPVLIALYSAVRRVVMMGGRFVWIRDIARPDLTLTVVVAALAALGTVASGEPSTQNRVLMTVLPAVVTLIVLSKMAAGIGLYWGMSSAFSVVQSVIAKRQPA